MIAIKFSLTWEAICSQEIPQTNQVISANIIQTRYQELNQELKNYEKKLKLFNYSFVIGSGMIVFGCIMKIILRAIDANNWGIYDTLSFALPLFPTSGIMIVICIALIKLLSLRRQYNIEMNTTQVVIANLYILTSLLIVILNFILCTMASNLNENYSSSDNALSESEFADSVD